MALERLKRSFGTFRATRVGRRPERHSRGATPRAPLAPAGRPAPGYLLVVLSAFLFAAGGNAVKALFGLGNSPQVLAQLRIWWAFAWLFLILLTVRPALLRVKLRELPALCSSSTWDWWP